VPFGGGGPEGWGAPGRKGGGGGAFFFFFRGWGETRGGGRAPTAFHGRFSWGAHPSVGAGPGPATRAGGSRGPGAGRSVPREFPALGARPDPPRPGGELLQPARGGGGLTDGAGGACSPAGIFLARSSRRLGLFPGRGGTKPFGSQTPPERAQGTKGPTPKGARGARGGGGARPPRGGTDPGGGAGPSGLGAARGGRTLFSSGGFFCAEKGCKFHCAWKRGGVPAGQGRILGFGPPWGAWAVGPDFPGGRAFFRASESNRGGREFFHSFNKNPTMVQGGTSRGSSSGSFSNQGGARGRGAPGAGGRPFPGGGRGPPGGPMQGGERGGGFRGGRLNSFSGLANRPGGAAPPSHSALPSWGKGGGGQKSNRSGAYFSAMPPRPGHFPRFFCFTRFFTGRVPSGKAETGGPWAGAASPGAPAGGGTRCFGGNVGGLLRTLGQKDPFH